MESAKDDGRGYDELALRSDVFTGNLSFGVADLLKDALASKQVVVPRVGKSNPSRRSIQQPCAEIIALVVENVFTNFVNLREITLRAVPCDRADRREPVFAGATIPDPA
jgi:hypothetical protein